MARAPVALCLLACCVCAVHAQELGAAPRIEFIGGTTFDAGDVRPNQTLGHVFTCRNTGDAAAKIAPLVTGDG